MVSQAFPKSKRLLTANEFQQVFDAVEHKQGGKHFTMLARCSSKPGHRLGIIVSKRTAQSAVQRNRIKRLIRESFRCSTSNIMHQANANKSVDIIVLAKPGCVSIANNTLLTALDKQWLGLNRKIGLVSG